MPECNQSVKYKALIKIDPEYNLYWILPDNLNTKMFKYLTSF